MRLLKRNNYSSLSDELLILEYRKKAHSSILGELYVRYGHLVMGTCMKYMKNRFNAEDISMHVFEKLGNRIQTNEIQHFKSWLFAVTRNECLMVLRKKGTVHLELTRDPVYEEPTGEKELQEIRLESLEAALEELKEEQRECIRLFYLERKSYEEIASQLSFDLNKVKSAIQNGKRNLKIQLEGRNEFKSNP